MKTPIALGMLVRDGTNQLYVVTRILGKFIFMLRLSDKFECICGTEWAQGLELVGVNYKPLAD